MNKPYRPSNAKLEDCREHGPGSGAELLLVEGDSALASVVAVRDERHQAVLALQGKPLNAWVATPARVAQHVQYQLLAQALGTVAGAVATPSDRFERVVLMFDADADGIHIGALMVLYVQRWLPALIEQGRLWQVRAPMFELVAADSGEVHQTDNPMQQKALVEQLTLAAGGQRPRVQAYRGLGSMAPEVLRRHCVNPSTRNAHGVSAADLQAVIEIFGGNSG
jgi:DNA gyrase subunit B